MLRQIRKLKNRSEVQSLKYVRSLEESSQFGVIQKPLEIQKIIKFFDKKVEDENLEIRL